MTEEKKPEARKETSPLRDALECRMKRVEIIGKIEEIKSGKIMDELTVSRMEMENKEIAKRGTGWITPVDQLMNVAKAWYVDNEKTIVGSEPAIRSLWDEDEIVEIKRMIMQKVRKL